MLPCWRKVGKLSIVAFVESGQREGEGFTRAAREDSIKGHCHGRTENELGEPLIS
jgi:hypothetical protein